MATDFMMADFPQRINHVDELNKIFLHMEFHKGSDVFLQGGAPVCMSWNGRKVMITKRKLQTKEVIGIITMMYGENAESRLNSAERIDTAHEFKVITGEDKNGDEEYERFRYRVNCVSSSRDGRSLTITVRSIPTTPKNAYEMGIEQEIIDVFMKTEQGLAAIVGATGNGKSTTLAALIRTMQEAEEAHRNLVTIESPIEFVHDGYYMPCSIFTQMEVGSHIKAFSEGVENAMRMAPTTILVGETRDYGTITASVEASVTGHFVMTTMHANSVDETFQRALALYPESMQHQAQLNIVSSMKIVVAQRLLRTVQGGRTAIRSFLVLDQQIKDELYRSKNLGATAFSLVERHGKPMMDDVEAKYKEGLLSQEVYESQKFNYGMVREQYK
ncbi:ATPase, T2SS/T4P/T4SS family [Pseudomonas syringae pv. actinidiae]|nr:ATPase, T2SS/T4P/T4SS family [Pseudomonas syringae pv. actinidiae]